jgi:hypothetical protein
LSNTNKKLELYGIKNNGLKWFQSYLDGRKQVIKFGASLSPILFILFINDILNIIKHSEVNFFADDTLIAVAADSFIY